MLRCTLSIDRPGHVVGLHRARRRRVCRRRRRRLGRRPSARRRRRGHRDRRAGATSGTEADTAPDRHRRGPTEPSTTAADELRRTGGGRNASPGPGEHHVEDEGEPVKGGTLVFGLEADTANAWAPYRASYATSGLHPARRRSPTRCSPSPTRARPSRCSSSRSSHNADYTEWTLHIRDGITFHDGTPLDGAAVKFNIDANRAAPLTRRRADADRHRDRVGPGRRDHDQGRARGWPCPNYLTVRLDRVHAVADVAGQPARHPAAHRGWSGLRRRGRGHAGRRRPGEAGRARGVHVRVVHAGQRQRLPRRAQRGLLARPERHHRRGPAVPRRHRGGRGGRHRQPPERRCGRASSTPCTPPTPTPSASSSTTTAWRSRRRAATATRRTTSSTWPPGPSSTPRARTRPARCSTSTAAGRWPTPWTASGWSRSAAPGWC